MGDGGVACMPVFQHNIIMDRFPDNNTVNFSADTSTPSDSAITPAIVSNIDNDVTMSNETSAVASVVSNGNSSKTKKVIKRIIKVRKVVTVKKPVGVAAPEKTKKPTDDEPHLSPKILEQGDDEIEEGELGTLSSPLRVDLQNEEFPVAVTETIGKDTDVGGTIINKIIHLEKRDLLPNRLQAMTSDVGHCEMRDESSPFTCKKFGEDYLPQKDINRSVFAPHEKEFIGWYGARDKSTGGIGLDTGDEEFCKDGYGTGRYRNRLKRVGTNSGACDRKHYGDYDDYLCSKIRKFDDDSSRHAGYKGTSSSSRVSKVQKYSRHHSDRHYDFRDRSPLSLRRDRSPFCRERSPYGHERISYGRERSPDRARVATVRDKSPYGRDKSPNSNEKSVLAKSPVGREKSPYSRSRNTERRCKSPLSELSPHDRLRHLTRRDRTSNVFSRSPRDRSCKHDDVQNRKFNASEKKKSSSKLLDNGKMLELDVQDTQVQDKASDVEAISQVPTVNENHSNVCKAISEHQSKVSVLESLEAVKPQENLIFMEEDMDICDTPPHVTLGSGYETGKWQYLDYFGHEQGPSRLFDLKVLVDDGVLVSDHFIKHKDSDRWVTIERAVSPVLTTTFPSIAPEAVTQLARPPEASGNLMRDYGDAKQSGKQAVSNFYETQVCRDGLSDSSFVSEFHIDERVEALLEGFVMTPGSQLDIIGDALQMVFDHVPLEVWNSEGIASYCFSNSVDHPNDWCEKKNFLYENACVLGAGNDDGVDTNEGCHTLWPCKGGDWKREEDENNDKVYRRKLTLNDCYPLCQMLKDGNEDPRWKRKDELYQPFQNRRLDLPLWGFSCLDEKNEVVGKSLHSKLASVRGVKGTGLPVIRINACVVTDHGSYGSETRAKSRLKEKPSSRSRRQHSTTKEVQIVANAENLVEKIFDDLGSSVSPNSASISIPKDRLCTLQDLQLQLGDWYYLDGMGNERGPHLYSELQNLVNQGCVIVCSSVFRKSDRVWIPVRSEDSQICDPGSALKKFETLRTEVNSNSIPFHYLHPQFIGYTRGKLHELVMKAFKNREFAAALNEFLDSWISSRSPRNDDGSSGYWESDSDGRTFKRPRKLDERGSDDFEIDEKFNIFERNNVSFDELCGDAVFTFKGSPCFASEMDGWGLLDGKILARVIHFLRFDTKSLTVTSLTCKHWKAAVSFYKDISQHVDFSSVGSQITDPVFYNAMKSYNKSRLKSIVLVGCTNVSSTMLEQTLRCFLDLTSIDVRGCTQFVDLIHKFPNVCWITSQSNRRTSRPEESVKRMSINTNDFNLTKYIESSNKRDFRGSLYKRHKLFDARNSSSIVSRDARTSRWSLKKADISNKKMEECKKMEEFLVSGLKDIMKNNYFDFFVSKVMEIEKRMKSGYYIFHGFDSVKKDIVCMCKDARKAKLRGPGDVNNIIEMFLTLASYLGNWSKSSYEKGQLAKEWKDELSGFSLLKRKKSFGDEVIRKGSKYSKKFTSSGSDYSDEFDAMSDTDISDTDSDVDFQPESVIAEPKSDGYFTADESSVTDEREWGARMTKASLVPPVTRKYEVIDRYVVVADEEDVKRKMSVSLPDDYAEKLYAQKNGPEELDMELPEVKDFKPRKELGDEVIEQEVYGIDPYTHNLILDSMPKDSDWTLIEKHTFIENLLLRTLNKHVRHFTGSGNTPMIYPLRPVIEDIEKDAAIESDDKIRDICRYILRAMDNRLEDNYVAYRKGLGVVCDKVGGFEKEDFVVEFLGEVYPAWKWFEKQDGIRSLQKDSQEPAPEFYNIYLERPKGDADGYDLVVVDAMHKANYASRICHSCKPNCLAKVTAVEGRYQIGIYTTRRIHCGDEITFDYNSVTESKEEYEASVCLCGSQVCRGSYLNLTGEGAFQKVLKKFHGVLDRYRLMIEACELNSVSEEDYLELGRAGLGSCLLGGLPEWVIAYSARLVRFINWERTKLPREILRFNLEEKRKYFTDIDMEVEKSDAEVQAEGVYNQRLQNLTVTLDKVRYVMRCVFGDAKKAPPLIEKLTPEETVSFLWKGKDSIVHKLLSSISPHVDSYLLNTLKSKIHEHDPLDSHDITSDLQKALLWLRDELRTFPCTEKCRHDAAADLIHVYAHTKNLFKIRKYATFSSPPVYISPLDLGPKHAVKLENGNLEYCKTYGENYCLGQLIFWHVLTNSEPDCTLDSGTKGCISLPSFGSFYSSVEKPSKILKAMIERMERYPQKAWPEDQFWAFERFPDIVGTPMLDSVLSASNSPLDKDMMTWLRQRPSVPHHS